MASRIRKKNRLPFWDRADMDVLEATSESFRIQVDQAFQKFLSDEEAKDFSFPTNLNNFERKHIHQKAVQYNLISKSHGKEPNRTLTVYKKGVHTSFEGFYIDVCPSAAMELKWVENLQFESPLQNDNDILPCDNRIFSHLALGEPCRVQEPKPSAKMLRFRQRLPIFDRKDVLLNAIRNNSVVIVSSETGSGKTTQIPQYIMDDCRERGEHCRIICTQPRRISAVSVAERVSEERGFKVGEVVGYHVRLESKISSNSNLIYCTNGVLIRNLMSGNEAMKTLTHIIVDEVHERDKLSDFLLICLRQILQQGIPIKIILMSATLNIDKFENYFGNPAVLNVPGRLFPIKQFFLDEVLEMTNYWKVLEDRKRFLQEPLPVNETFDAMLQSIWHGSSTQGWHELIKAIIQSDFDINYQHSETGVTAIIIAVHQKNLNVVEKLCTLGCNPKICCKSGYSAMTLAESMGLQEILLILKMASYSITKQQDILNEYYKSSDDEEIDYDLLIRLICFVHGSYQQGAILVFLPGYDDIMLCNDLLNESDMDRNTYRVFFLHGSMSIREQHEVFNELPNKRKIILSTNIAETSLTIDDVVYVIDSGKAKEQNYDSATGQSSLQTQWVSKACVKQRAGRAGRTQSGIAFHLFSRNRHEAFLDERKPEILRVPLEELCLNTKSLAGQQISIYNFLSLAPDAPSPGTVKTAIDNLQCLGALDKDENLTCLGKYLNQLTIAPHLGKMLIYSTFFNCLDPVLTMVASMAQKDPFQLPAQAHLRTAAGEKRKTFMMNTYSDHLVYIMAFIKWQAAVKSRNERNFCNDFFISRSTMETIQKTRSQLVSQLRALGLVPPGGNMMRNINQLSDNWPLIKATIASGLYPKIAFIKGNNYCTRTEKKVFVHHSNPLCKESINLWLVYEEMVKFRNGNQLRGVTPITPLTISLFCGTKATNPSENILEIDDWLEFEFRATSLIKLRAFIDMFVARKLTNPHSRLNSDERKVLEALARILTIEDHKAGLISPEGISQVPLFHDFNRSFDFATVQKRPIRKTNSSSDSSSTSSCVSPSLNRAVFLLINAKMDYSVQRAQIDGKWIFSPQTEKKIIDLDRRGASIYLFYSIPATKTYCGIAKFTNFDFNGCKPRANIEWIFKTWLPYNEASHVRNSLNDNRLVHQGFDGQQIEFNSALELWEVFGAKH